MRSGPTWAVAVAVLVFSAGAAAELDYYKCLRYPKQLVPGVGRDTVEQAGGPQAVGYRRRTVQWWPRHGQDVVDIPEGAPLRVWTRNKGQIDKEALAGVCRTWTTSDPDTFQAHLIGFRGFGVPTPDPRHNNYVLVPAAVLRMAGGERRAILAYPPFHMMVSQADHDFIFGIWQEQWKKIQAAQSQDEYVSSDYRVRPDSLILETKHFTFVSDPKTEYKTLWWMRPHEPEKQNAFRKASLEFAENMWTHIEASGSSMPYWRRDPPWKKYNVLIRLAIDGGWAGGGFGACDLRDATGGPRNLGLSHEWYHGHPGGGWSATFFGESVCHGGRHFNIPGEVLMFSHNFCYPWRNVSCTQYQCALWFFALGDSPNWGYGIISVAGCLAAAVEPTAYHTIARLGQERGLWENGVKGFGDFFGEYAARMVTCDFVMQYALRCKYGMPEMSFLQPVYGQKNRYRTANSEAPRMYGFNMVRLVPAEDAAEISVDFQGLDEPEIHGDWRACIVAVDANGRARYSPLWNKGIMDFALRGEDKHLWLTVAATPSAMPISPSGNVDILLAGIHAPRYPWEVTLTGCQPGLPHRRPGDVINLDELYAMNNGNKYMGYPVKSEVPIPLADEEGQLAQEKLADILRRVKAAAEAQTAKIEAGEYDVENWWEKGKIKIFEELKRRVKFLQRSATGHRHENGGGFVSDNARVAATAYVGPNAMVLDGARVEGNACIHEYAVVHGPKTVIRDNAKIGGKAWVFGELTVGGNARILESATVTTVGRSPIGRDRASCPEGQAEISGNAVLKGEHILRLCQAKSQVLTGELVMDYTPGYSGTVGYFELVPGIVNLESGVYQHGRICGRGGLGGGVNAGGLYASWQFNQPKAVLLEDSYVNNNGVLHGRPSFADDGQRKCIVFNGKNQYAEAPPSVADFAELTIDACINRSGGTGRVFDFGTGDDECFYLTIERQGGKPVLAARHQGKSYRVAASEGVPANKWTRVRVEMDGSTAAIYLDGKQVAKQDFALRPSTVFVPDRPEGNFIACGRNIDEFFSGRIDHFRIYRQIHDNFDSLGPVPLALTQLQEWSEEDRQRADAWDGRRKAKEAELKAGKYGEIQDEIKRLHEQKAALQKTSSLAELEARVREAEKQRNDLNRKIHDDFRALPETVQTQQEVDQLRQKMDAIMQEIRQNGEYTKLSEEIQTCEKKRRDLDRQVRELPKLKAIDAEARAADQEKRVAEERIRDLPELKKAKEMQEQEEDSQNKRKLQEKYNRLFEARRLSDPGWWKADVAQRRLRETYNQTLRNEISAHAGRKKLGSRLQGLRKDLNALTARLQESHPEYSKLQDSRSAKQKDLQRRRSQFEARAWEDDEYKAAEAAITAARKAVDDEKKRIEQANSGEAAKLDTRIGKLQQRSRALWETALKNARVFGQNPYPGKDAARLKDFQQNLQYHTTVDWDYRTREEVSGKVTPKMKEWLLRVRGY
jgi:hypothetical protein